MSFSDQNLRITCHNC